MRFACLGHLWLAGSGQRPHCAMTEGVHSGVPCPDHLQRSCPVAGRLAEMLLMASSSPGPADLRFPLPGHIWMAGTGHPATDQRLCAVMFSRT